MGKFLVTREYCIPFNKTKSNQELTKIATWYFAATWYSAAAWYFVWFAMSCNMNQVISEECGPSVLRSSAARSAQARCSPSGVSLQRRFTATAFHCSGVSLQRCFTAIIVSHHQLLTKIGPLKNLEV